MSGITGAAAKVGRTHRGLLPSGQLLTPEVWARRHRGIVWLLWLHVAGIASCPTCGFQLATGRPKPGSNAGPPGGLPDLPRRRRRMTIGRDQLPWCTTAHRGSAGRH